MRPFLLLWPIAVLAGCTPPTVTSDLPTTLDGPTAPARPAGIDNSWRSLINEPLESVWKVDEKNDGHWVIRDGVLSYDGNGDTLWSVDSFGDVEIVLDWRWTQPPTDTARPVILPTGETATNGDQPMTVMVMDAGDSGVYLRGSSKSQVNIWCWPCGSGEVYGYRTDASMPPMVRAGVTPTSNEDRPIGEWNRFLITIIGDELTVALNGVTVLDHARLPGVATTGTIALQHHWAPIEFANMYVRSVAAE